MRKVLTVIVAMMLVAACGQEASEPTPAAAPEMAEEQALVTASDFARAHPERLTRLLDALNLDHPGLEAVKVAHSQGDLTAAAEALSAYYRTTDNGPWLRERTDVHDPGGYEDIPRKGDEVLEDFYTFQAKSGTIVRKAGGGIDWLHYGPNDDWQWSVFLNRHFQLIPVLKAYALDPKPEYARAVDATIQDWVIANYPPAEAENDRLLPPPWKPMGSASRLLQVWPQVFYYMQADPAFTDAGRLMMVSSVHEQAEHLLRYHRVRHNHAVKEMVGLAHAAVAWPEFKDAGMWLDHSLKILTGELEVLLYPSGVQRELSAHYHRTVLEYMLQYVEFRRLSGIPAPDEFEKRIEDMGYYMAWAVRPDGHVPLNNNADRDDVRKLVMKLADIFDHDDWRYIISNGAQGTAPGELPSKFFGYAGQLISRSGFDETAEWSFFDIGPYGTAHQHPDRLHLSIAAGGRDLLVDTGRYVYKHEDPLREYVISSAGHNIIMVDGKGQGPQPIENLEPMRGVAAVTERFSFAAGAFEEGFVELDGTAAHYRSVAHVPGLGWFVADYLETDRPRELTAHWHAHPRVTLVADGLDMVSNDAGKGNIRITPVGLPDATDVSTARGANDPALGWYSVGYNQIEPTTLARYQIPTEGSQGFGWVMSVDMEGTPAPVTAEQLEAPAGAVRYRATIDGQQAELAFRLAGDAPVPLSGGYQLDGRFAMLIGDEVHVAQGVVTDGTGAVVARHEDPS